MNPEALVLLLALAATPPSTGPAIEGYGPVFDVPGSSFELATDRDHQVVFDVASSPDETGELNRRIETVARFLNMHARQGLTPDKLDVALVLHGSAGKDALSDAAYRARFDRDNPNAKLMKALHHAGVKIYLCGQTAAFRGFTTDDLASSVQMARSAMTVLVALQEQDYALIAF